jgi:Na+-transporting NADH:ubiquinone oxidoreductase subunit NqrC
MDDTESVLGFNLGEAMRTYGRASDRSTASHVRRVDALRAPATEEPARAAVARDEKPSAAAKMDTIVEEGQPKHRSKLILILILVALVVCVGAYVYLKWRQRRAQAKADQALQAADIAEAEALASAGATAASAKGAANAMPTLTGPPQRGNLFQHVPPPAQAAPQVREEQRGRDAMQAAEPLPEPPSPPKRHVRAPVPAPPTQAPSGVAEPHVFAEEDFDAMVRHAKSLDAQLADMGISMPHTDFEKDTATAVLHYVYSAERMVRVNAAAAKSERADIDVPAGVEVLSDVEESDGDSGVAESKTPEGSRGSDGASRPSAKSTADDLD